MIRRLIEADHAATPSPDDTQLLFWLREARTPALLIELARRHPALTEQAAVHRPLLHTATVDEEDRLEADLLQEELAERQRDKEYWLPLKRELEQMRRAS